MDSWLGLSHSLCEWLVVSSSQADRHRMEVRGMMTINGLGSLGVGGGAINMKTIE